MNKLTFNTIIALALVLFTTACKKEDNSSNNSNVSNIVAQGDWRITLYNESGTDELYHFTGYTFTFTNGNVTAVKGANSISGTYSTGIDDSKNKMYLDFGTTVPFDELNDDWQIIEETTTKIRLQDVSGGNGGTDLLTFEKN